MPEQKEQLREEGAVHSAWEFQTDSPEEVLLRLQQVGCLDQRRAIRKTEVWAGRCRRAWCDQVRSAPPGTQGELVKSECQIHDDIFWSFFKCFKNLIFKNVYFFIFKFNLMTYFFSTSMSQILHGTYQNYKTIHRLSDLGYAHAKQKFIVYLTFKFDQASCSFIC